MTTEQPKTAPPPQDQQYPPPPAPFPHHITPYGYIPFPPPDGNPQSPEAIQNGPPQSYMMITHPQFYYPAQTQAYTPPQNGQAQNGALRPKRKQVKMACTNCAQACKRCDESRPCERCIKYNLTESCVDGQRKERKKGIKRGPYKRKNRLPGGEPGAFPDSTDGAAPPQEWNPNASPPATTPATTAAAIQAVQQFVPGEGFYPFYYPPPGFLPPHPHHAPPPGHEGQPGAEAPNGAPPPPHPPPHPQHMTYFVPGPYPPFPYPGFIHAAPPPPASAPTTVPAPHVAHPGGPPLSVPPPPSAVHPSATTTAPTPPSSSSSPSSPSSSASSPSLAVSVTGATKPSGGGATTNGKGSHPPSENGVIGGGNNKKRARAVSKNGIETNQKIPKKKKKGAKVSKDNQGEEVVNGVGNGDGGEDE